MFYKRYAESWHQAGLISIEQKNAILQYEEKRPSSRLVPTAMLAVAAISISTGLISIIASNWDKVAPISKLITLFSLLGITIAGLFAYEQKKGVIRELLILTYSGLIIGGIGLIAQIYHIESEGWSGFLLWNALTIAPVLAARNPVSPIVWWASWYISVLIWGNVNTTVISDPNLRYGVMAAFCLVPYLLDSIIQNHQKFFSLSRYVGRGLIYIIGPISINIYFLDTSDTFNYWPVIAIVLLIAATKFLPDGDQSTHKQRKVTALYLALLSLFLCLSIEIQTSSTLTRQILGAGSFFVLTLVLARICLLMGSTTLFNGVTAAISVRVIVLYLEVFGSLLTTGIGLIVSGIIILIIMWAWNKTRLKTFRNEGTHHE